MSRTTAYYFHVTRQSRSEILLSVYFSRFVDVTRWPWLAAVRAIPCCHATWPSNAPTVFEIGRASCRESVTDMAVTVSINEYYIMIYYGMTLKSKEHYTSEFDTDL